MTIQETVQNFIDKNMQNVLNSRVLLMGSAALYLQGILDYKEDYDIDVLVESEVVLEFGAINSNHRMDFVRYARAFLAEDFIDRTIEIMSYNGVSVRVLSPEDIIATMISGYAKPKHKNMIHFLLENNLVDKHKVQLVTGKANERVYIDFYDAMFHKYYQKFLSETP